MTGKELVPYQHYAPDNDVQIKRIRNDNKKEGEKRSLQITLMIAGAGVIILVALAIDQLWLTILWALVTGSAFAWAVLNTNFGVTYKTLYFACPHCEEQNNVSQEWICGWCTAENEGSETLPFDKCGHETCNKRPTAMRCWHCGRDIIFDNTAYLAERAKGFGRIAGVVTWKNGAPQAMRGDVQNLKSRVDIDPAKYLKDDLSDPIDD